MKDISVKVFTSEILEEINRILKRGNTVELKNENSKLVVVEINRKAKIKTSITG